MNFLPSNPPDPADPNKSFGDVVRDMARDAQARKNKIVQHGQQKQTARENAQSNPSGQSDQYTPDTNRRQQQGQRGDRQHHDANPDANPDTTAPSADSIDLSIGSPADRRVPLLPVISPRALALANWRAGRTLHKQFSAVRISKRGLAPAADELPDKPVLIYCNHPSIWTSSLGLYLATKFWPTWRHYSPAEPAQISTIALTRKIGLFPAAQGKLGRVPLMRTARNVLYCPGHMLWLPATTTPVDPRLRPMPIHPAITHLSRKFDDIVILPLAIEHPYRIAPLPEALVRFGEPFHTLDAGRRSGEGWHNLLQRRLQMVMDRLSEESADPHPDEFLNLQ